jgi:hypothetical protein
MGLPIETAPARPPELGVPEPSIAAVPPVTDGAVTGRAPVVPATSLALEWTAASSPLHAHRIQPDVITMHRAARVGVFDLAIANLFPGTA